MSDVLLFTEGFDHYGAISKIGPTRKWTSVSGFASLATGRFSGQCVTAGGIGTFVVFKTFTTTYANLVVGFAFQASALAAFDILIFKEGSQIHAKLSMESSGQLSAYQGNGTLLGKSTQVITAGAWHYIEFFCAPADTGGRAKFNVDNANWIDFTGDTRNGVTGVLDTIQLGGTGKFDDVYVINGVGFLNECRVVTLNPSSDGGTNQWTALSGGAHYQEVRETAVDDDTSYVKDSTVGDIELWGFTSLPGSGIGAIKGVQQTTRCRKDDATARNICNLLKSGSAANLEGASVAMATAYDYIIDMQPTDPNTGVAWVAAGVNAVKSGVKVKV